MRTKARLSSLVVSLAIVLSYVWAPLASASFNRHNIMSDNVFSNKGSMNSSQIDSWLNTHFPNSCISTNSGFSARDPTGYLASTGKYTYGGNVTAGRVISDAARAYGLNPEVLLATLQKEEGLVRGDGPYGCGALAMSAAVGYGCPDGGKSYSYSGVNLYTRNGTTVTSVSGTCVNSSSKVGFSQQVIHAAWLLRFGQERSLGNTGWNVQYTDYPQTGDRWDNSDDPPTTYGGPMTQGYRARVHGGSVKYYDGLTTIDGTSVHMDTGATAALYWYTPHFSGNQNFYDIFTGWFGSTTSTASYAWSYAGQTAYSDLGRTKAFTTVPTVAPGGTFYVTFNGRNTGYQPWSQSSLHLGTSHPRDRTSQFHDGSWFSTVRPAQMQQSSVVSGDTATFQFSMTAPANTGTYTEYFSLVADGIKWLNDPGFHYVINVVQPFSAKYSGDSIQINTGDTMHPGDSLISPGGHYVLAFQKDGNVVLYEDFKAAWNTHTAGKKTDRFTLQSDGNLVLYEGATARWSSKTTGGTTERLTLQSDGNLVLYNQANSALWSSATKTNPDDLHHINTTMSNALLFPGQQIETADGHFRFTLQYDGNLVLYNRSTGKAIWSSRTKGSMSYLAMQGDGNLVLYSSSGKAVWYTRTKGSGSYLVMQGDGNLVLYSHGKAQWNTRTHG